MQSPQDEDRDQRQDRLTYSHHIPPLQIPRLQREGVACPDESHDRRAERYPVAEGYFRVPMSEQRGEDYTHRESKCARRHHHCTRRRDVFASLARLPGDVEAHSGRLAHRANHLYQGEPSCDCGILTTHRRPESTCHDDPAYATSSSSNDVESRCPDNRPPRTRPPQRRCEPLQPGWRGVSHRLSTALRLPCGPRRSGSG
jgi:hypothetical protein